MAWPDVMQELENKVEGTLKGTYRPLDNFRLFRLQYPPQEEREAIRQFHQLQDRLLSRGWPTKLLSLKDIFQEALVGLIGHSRETLQSALINLETSRNRAELQNQLSEYLPDELGKLIDERLSDCSNREIAILLRMGCLYPFIRSSSLVAVLEGRTQCTVILPYPGVSLGALLDAPPADPRGGYYRGESIAWR
jgi:hypothetical protein